MVFLLLLMVAILGIGTWLWISRDTPKPWLDMWLYTPTTEAVSSDIDSQVEVLLPNGEEAKLAISDVSILHRRGEVQGTWSAVGKVRITAPRYEPVDWAAAVEKAGFDATRYSKALVASALDSNTAPRKPDEKTPKLAKEVIASGQTVELALKGAVLLKGKNWVAFVDDLAGVDAQIDPLLRGHPLNEIGEGAVREDSEEARRALATYIEERQTFIQEVEAAALRADQARKQKEKDNRAEAEQAAAGLAQAGWHALEKLSGYLVNTGINQRLIGIATQRGDKEKASLYRSYEDSNRQNIQDAATAYAQSMTELSRLPLDVRQKAIKDIQAELATMGLSVSPWKTSLVNRMSTDAETLPNFRQNGWMDELRQLREQK